MFAIVTLSHTLRNYGLFVMLCASQTFGHRRTCAIGQSSDAGTMDESCGMYSSFAYSFIATTVCALTSNRTQSRKSKCVWLSTSTIVNYLWWVAHHKRSTTEYRLRWQCEHKQVARMDRLAIRDIRKSFIGTTVCTMAPYPRWFLGCVGRTPLSPTLTWRRFQMPPWKGVKNRLYSTSLY